MGACYNGVMSYTVTLWCGCRVYVACHPATGLAHTRVVESTGSRCPVRRHTRGMRVWLWELLPDPRQPDPRLEYERASN
jgi:hypothetical protein